MIIFDADDPLVLAGVYDQEGYKPGERARIAKARLRAIGADQSRSEPNGANYTQLEATILEATMAKRASKMDKKLSKPDTRKKKPKQQELIEDRAIKPIEKLATDYRDLIDERMDLTTREAALKQQLIRLLHKYGKTEYRRGGLVIRLVAGEEKVSVRVAKEGEDEEDDDALENIDPEAEPEESEAGDETGIAEPPADDLPRA